MCESVVVVVVVRWVVLYPHGLVFPKWWSLFGHLYHSYPQRPNIYRIPVALLKRQLGPSQWELRVVFFGVGGGTKKEKDEKGENIRHPVWSPVCCLMPIKSVFQLCGNPKIRWWKILNIREVVGKEGIKILCDIPSLATPPVDNNILSPFISRWIFFELCK